MKFTKIEGSNVPRYVNFNAVRFLWIEDLSEEFCEKHDALDERWQVVAEHDIYLRSFATLAEAEAYVDELVKALGD